MVAVSVRNTHVITPKTKKPPNVAWGVAKKNYQAPNIIVNIRNNPKLSAESLGGSEGVLQGVRDLIEPTGSKVKIRSVLIIE